MNQVKNYIHGQSVCSSKNFLDIDDPSKGETIREVVLSNSEDFNNVIHEQYNALFTGIELSGRYKFASVDDFDLLTNFMTDFIKGYKTSTDKAITRVPQSKLNVGVQANIDSTNKLIVDVEVYFTGSQTATTNQLHLAVVQNNIATGGIRAREM